MDGQMTLRLVGLHCCKTAQQRAGGWSGSETTSTNEAAQAEFVLGIEWHDRQN